MGIRRILVEFRIDQEGPLPYERFADDFKDIISAAFIKSNKGNLKVEVFENDKKVFVSDQTLIKNLDYGILALRNINLRVGSLLITPQLYNGGYKHQVVISCVREVITHIDDEFFGAVRLASNVHLSKATLYRKIKLETGLNVSDFIREIKLQIAYRLLETKEFTVREVSGRCGYSSVQHFSKIFLSFFHIYPSTLVSNEQKKY
jgi:AraC-like DNA-binding protein